MNQDTLTILIVDDDTFLLDMYALKFKESGHVVEVSRGAEDALRILRDGLRPNVILTDIVMPEVDGIALIQTIRKEGFDNPAIVVLSNQGQETDITKALESGASDYIVKASSVPSEVVQKTVAIARAHNQSK